MSLETIRAKYPYLSYMLEDPEVAGVVEEADRLHPGDANWLNGAISQTNWWKTHSPSERDYHSMAQSDPAGFWQKVQVKADWITDKAAELGLDLTSEQIYEAAKAALYFGRSNADIQRALVYGSGGTISQRSSVQAQVKKLANDYWIPMDEATVQDWTRKISSGQYTSDNLTAQLQAWATQMYPHLTQIIQSGTTLEAYAAPYKSAIGSVLETPGSNINMATDPRWKQVIDYVDEKGNQRPMTMTEAEKYARTQPEWKFTKNSLDQGADLAQTLLTTFGKVA